MTTPRDADRILRAWLDLMPDEAPDRTVAAVLQAVETTPQTRRPLVRAPWRSTPMTRFALIAAAAALGVALLGGALYVGGLGDSSPGDPTATPSTLPTGTWSTPKDGISFGLPSGATSESLTVDPDRLWVTEQGFPEGSRAFVSSITATSDREIELRVISVTRLGGRGFEPGTPVSMDGVAFAGCELGDLGTYGWTAAADGQSLVLTSLGDECPAREVVLARTWMRTAQEPGTSPSVTPSPVALDPLLRARWVAPAPTGAEAITLDGAPGTLRFVVESGGMSVRVEVGDSTGASVQSDALQTGPDELTLTLAQAGSGCTAGDIGRYRWALDEAQTTLTLTRLEDPCVARAEALGRSWSRTLMGSSDVPTGVVNVFEPAFDVTLPNGFYNGRPMRDAIEITRGDNQFTFLAFKNPQAFVDPCSTERQEWAPGGRALVDALKAIPVLTEFAEEEHEIGGFPALRVTYMARSDMETCAGEQPYNLWAPRDDPNAQWVLSAGDADLLYVVDHPDGTLMFQVLPIDDAGTADVMASIEFNDLPAAP